MLKYKDFECVYGDKDTDGNSYMCIDGYPENMSESGAVIATVYMTPHKDFVVHFNLEEYRDVSEVNELIEQAKNDLLEYSRKDLAQLIEEQIDSLDAVFKVKDDTYTVKPSEYDSKKGVLELDLEMSDGITALFADTILPPYKKTEILREYDSDNLEEAISYGAEFTVSVLYYADHCTDELSLETAQEQNDVTVRDSVAILFKYPYDVDSYLYAPDNQKWFRDFVNEELAGLGEPTARTLIEKSMKEVKEKKNIERT